ncbi:MAG: ABC transporter substrate-binding protein [Bacillota bacterium]
MIKRSRTLTLVLALALILSLIAGCSGAKKEEPKNQPPAAEPAKKDPVTINFWAYEPDNPEAKKTLEGIVDSWNKANPDIQVKLSTLPRDTWYDKLNAAIAGKVGPDITYLDQPLVPKWAKEGTLLEITAMADGPKGIKRDEYIKGALDTNIVGGKLYGLPLNMTAVAMFYNKDLVPNPPKTWDEWLAVSKQVYKKGEVSAFEGPWGGGWGAWLFPAFGGTNDCYMANEANTEVTFNSPQCVETFKFLHEIFKNNDWEVITSNEAFGNGKVAMKVSGPWDVVHYKNNFPKLNFGVTLIPKKTRYASNIGGENIVILKDTKHPEEAFQVLKYLTNDENSLKFATVTGNFPIRVKAAEDAKYKNDPYLSVFMEQMKYALARPRIDEWLKINDEILGAVLDDLQQKGKDPKPILDEAAQKANALIKK